MRQYPVQFMAGIVALLGSVLGVALYVSHVKLRAARRVEDFSFTDPLTEGWSLARFRSEVGAQMANAAMALTPSCTST